MRDHAPHQRRPLGGYAVLMAVWSGATAAFAGWFARSGRPLPDRMAPADVALLAAGSAKAARLVTKDRVGAAVRAPFTTFQGDAGPGEVDEAARGTGMRRAIGELLVCPYCMSVWVLTALSAGMLVAPRATRWIAATLTALYGSDYLQLAYAKASSR